MTGVYFVQHGDLIKVGYSRQVGIRTRTIKSGRANATVIGVIPCPKRNLAWLEATWLHRLNPWRYRGEWFHAAPEVLETIATHAKAPTADDLNAARLRPKVRERPRSQAPVQCLTCGVMMPRQLPGTTVHCSCGTTYRMPASKARRSEVGRLAARARAESLSPEQRSAIARNAALIRHARNKDNPKGE